jgi:hypothetical protein
MVCSHSSDGGSFGTNPTPVVVFIMSKDYMMKTAVLKTLSFERPVDLKSAIVAQGVASAHSQKRPTRPFLFA